MNAVPLVSICALIAKLQFHLVHASRIASAYSPQLHLNAPPRVHGTLIRSGSHRSSAPRLQVVAPPLDLVGDGGVLKSVTRAGSGIVPTSGAIVEVHYEGKLDTGAVFDSSRARGQTFKFKTGEGRVIGGWEVGLSTMQVGELATITCAPQYAYGAQGVPPMIPPSATLTFDIELVSVENPQKQDEENDLSGKNAFMAFGQLPSIGTAKEADAEWKAMMAAKPKKKEGIAGFVEWVRSWYIFGIFTDKPGEKPPWWVNPILTFPVIFIASGCTFYFAFAMGGVHYGTDINDLSDVIGKGGAEVPTYVRPNAPLM